MKKAGGIWGLATVGGAVRTMQKNARTTRRQWLEPLVWALTLVLAAICVDADEVNANMTEIPLGPGKACIKYTSFYSALVDWSGGTPTELSRYYYISYDAVEFWHTAHSCVGGTPLYPGPLPEGNFSMIHGNLMAIVNIERIQDKCPYMLTYYYLKNPVSIPDPDGICVKGKPAPINTPNPDPGSPECGSRAPLN